MKVETAFEMPVLFYSLTRSLVYRSEYFFLNALSKVFPTGEPKAKGYDKKTSEAIQRELVALLKKDAKNIVDGVYPASVLKPESFLEHAKRFPLLIADGVSLYWRKRKGRTTVFDDNAKDFLEGKPKYYWRNFHFQTNGYLSDRSAELYEHQVEMLFGGAADAMRRLIISPLKKHFPKNKDGHGLTFLEVAAGTGRTSFFIREAFPKAKIVVTDMSDHYVKHAEKRLSRFWRMNFMQAAGEELPFQDQKFDAVFSIFLFHELPLETRKKVLSESRRVLKKDGFFGFVDSLQKDDDHEFGELLERFPKDFHEPFYRNYSEHDMETLMREAGFGKIKTGKGFFSKVCSATTK